MMARDRRDCRMPGLCAVSACARGSQMRSTTRSPPSRRSSNKARGRRVAVARCPPPLLIHLLTHPGAWSEIYSADQLRAAQLAGDVLVGFEEGAPDFAPTFKVRRRAGVRENRVCVWGGVSGGVRGRTSAFVPHSQASDINRTACRRTATASYGGRCPRASEPSRRRVYGVCRR